MVTVYQRMKYQELMAVNLSQNYFNNWLDSITNYEGQILLITDRDGQVLFFNRNYGLLPETLLTTDQNLADPKLAPKLLKKNISSTPEPFPASTD